MEVLNPKLPPASSKSDSSSANSSTTMNSITNGVLKTTTSTTVNNHHLAAPDAINGNSSSSNSNNSNRHRLSSTSSPGSASGRSSSSSLNGVGGPASSSNPSSLRNGHASSSASSTTTNGTAIPALPLATAAVVKKDSRKVSIQDHPVTLTPRSRDSHKLAASTNNISSAASVVSSSSAASTNLTSVSHRTSLLHISAEKRARKVRFFINNDRFFKGAVIAVSGEKFRTFEKLLEHLTRIMCNQVTLPNGVRYIFGLDGKLIADVAELSHEGNYLCSSNATFKKLDYLKLAQEQDQVHWNRIKRETYYFGLPGGGSAGKAGVHKRDAYKLSGHSKSFGQTKTAALNGAGAETATNFKPKIIAVLRSGMKPRRAVRVLLNHRNSKSFDTLLADLTNLVKLDSGAVRKVFTLAGKPVLEVGDFADAEVFIAYGSDKCGSDDFDLDMIEFRSVQAILKSPELDAKYEKFASASPKTSRRKFLSSRQPANLLKRKSRKQSSTSRTRASQQQQNQQQSGSGTPSNNGNHQYHQQQAYHSMGSAATSYPGDISSRYLVGDIIGDGNFAVVRKCFGKRTKKEYALKIIDKSKCQGKEHMIESEVQILNLVSHPNIIELLEVFDFVDEKYLVTEYVRGGDLFDAIAADTKYTEDVSRGMIRDLSLALKYLHDKMIVHRDIKPENLLVVDYPSQGTKSLKLGDFGLAQVVSEPLFTVCGTPTYVAPEILAETGYGVKVDVWATGVIMYILLVGFPPFSSRTNNQEELFDQILSGLFEFNSPDWDDISYLAKELISWMLQVDPLQRYSAYEILQHPWIKNNNKNNHVSGE